MLKGNNLIKNSLNGEKFTPAKGKERQDENTTR